MNALDLHNIANDVNKLNDLAIDTTLDKFKINALSFYEIVLAPYLVDCANSGLYTVDIKLPINYCGMNSGNIPFINLQTNSPTGLIESLTDPTPVDPTVPMNPNNIDAMTVFYNLFIKQLNVTDFVLPNWFDLFKNANNAIAAVLANEFMFTVVVDEVSIASDMFYKVTISW
jgi:hypothetical protein